MVQIDWSAPALADLQEVFHYIARDSQRYATTTVEQITSTTLKLANWPEMGETLRDFPPYREFIVGNYRLIYREDPTNHRILVIAIIHAARDLAPLMNTRDL